MSIQKPRPIKDRPYAITKFGPSKTQQNCKDECDINLIVKKHAQTGLLTHTNKNEPKYGDFTRAMPYQDAMNLVAQADEQFSLLPAELRKKFENDSAQFLAFCEDENNITEMQDLGILPKPKSPAAPPSAAAASDAPEDGAPASGGANPPPAKGKATTTPK